jgi:hypothetical protein
VSHPTTHPNLVFTLVKDLIESVYLGLWPLFGKIGDWIQGFGLAEQALYHLNHDSSPFYLVILVIGFENYLLSLTSNCNPPNLSS